MRTVLPATFSSAIWYFALQLSQRNFNGSPPEKLGGSVASFDPSGYDVPGTELLGGASEKLHQMLFDRGTRFRIGRGVHASLPHLDGLVLEPGLLVEDREVFQRGAVLRIEVDRTLELRDSIVKEALFPVDQGEMIPETVRERVDGDPLLEEGDR